MAAEGGGAPERTSIDRGQWGSRLGFILAAAGSAVGLGNIWRFPFEVGNNGGGLFVLIYLACIVVIGLPVMIAEVMIGRRAQRSPVPAYGRLSGDQLVWKLVGWMGVAAGLMILSFYSVVAGWTLDYVVLSLRGAFSGRSAEQIAELFGELTGSPSRTIMWHALFMAMTIGIVVGGVKKGVERGARVLMPALFLLIVGLLVYGLTLDGFGDAVSYLFAPNPEDFSGEGALSSLGQAFFSLSLGMGALITYGSYLRRDDDIVASSAMISGLDTFVALSAGMIIFPIVFSFGLDSEGGPGLVFQSMPVAFAQMPGGGVVAIIFFVLLVFAALTSAISLLEVVTSTVIDQFRWSRRKATVVVGALIFALGLPSAHGDLLPFWDDLFGMSFLDSLDSLTAKWFLPLGGLFISIFVGWILPANQTREEFTTGTKLGGLYPGWLFLVRFVVPVAITLVFLSSIGLI